jgi:hypothetical protein
MKEFVPHQIHLTKGQITKLGKGLASNLKHSQMGADKGDFVVMLHPQNARKMLTSFKKTKGMRLQLSPEEIEMTEKHGTGFFRTLKKWTGIGKTQFLGEAKKIGKQVVSKGAMAVGEAVGAYTGNPVAGVMLGQALGKAGEKTIDSIQPSKGKLGIKFDPREGVKSLKSDAKMYAVEAIDRQIDKLPPDQRRVAEKALAGEYPDASSFIMDAGMASVSGRGVLGKRPPKGSPEMKEYMAKLRGLKGNKGGKINIGKAFKNLGRDIKKGFNKEIAQPFMRDVGRPAEKALTSKDAMSAYKAIGKHAIEQGIPIATALGSMALGDPTGMSGAAMGNIASQYASKAYTDQVGRGMPIPMMRPRGRPRKQGGATASLSRPYKEALKYNYGGLEVASFADNAPVSSFKTNPRVRPSSTEMTLSPYQNLSSPAMNPFIPTSYTQEGGTSCGYGGRGLYGGGLF